MRTRSPALCLVIIVAMAALLVCLSSAQCSSSGSSVIAVEALPDGCVEWLGALVVSRASVVSLPPTVSALTFVNDLIIEGTSLTSLAGFSSLTAVGRVRVESNALLGSLVGLGPGALSFTRGAVIRNNSALTDIFFDVSEWQGVLTVQENAQLVTFSSNMVNPTNPANSNALEFVDNPKLRSVLFPNLNYTNRIEFQASSALTAASFPLLTTMRGDIKIFDAPLLSTGLDLSSLQSCNSLSLSGVGVTDLSAFGALSGSLESLSLLNLLELTSVDDLGTDRLGVTLDIYLDTLPQLASSGAFRVSPLLSGGNLSIRVFSCDQLSDLDFLPSLTTYGALRLIDLPVLPSSAFSVFGATTATTGRIVLDGLLRVSSLSAFSSLRRVATGGNLEDWFRITDLPSLMNVSGLENLEYAPQLLVQGTQVPNLDPLSSLTALPRGFSVRGESLTSISPLADLEPLIATAVVDIDSTGLSGQPPLLPPFLTSELQTVTLADDDFTPPLAFPGITRVSESVTLKLMGGLAAADESFPQLDSVGLLTIDRLNSVHQLGHQRLQVADDGVALLRQRDALLGTLPGSPSFPLLVVAGTTSAASGLVIQETHLNTTAGGFPLLANVSRLLISGNQLLRDLEFPSLKRVRGTVTFQLTHPNLENICALCALTNFDVTASRIHDVCSATGGRINGEQWVAAGGPCARTGSPSDGTCVVSQYCPPPWPPVCVGPPPFGLSRNQTNGCRDGVWNIDPAVLANSSIVVTSPVVLTGELVITNGSTLSFNDLGPDAGLVVDGALVVGGDSRIVVQPVNGSVDGDRFVLISSSSGDTISVGDGVVLVLDDSQLQFDRDCEEASVERDSTRSDQLAVVLTIGPRADRDVDACDSSSSSSSSSSSVPIWVWPIIAAVVVLCCCCCVVIVVVVGLAIGAWKTKARHALLKERLRPITSSGNSGNGDVMSF